MAYKLLNQPGLLLLPQLVDKTARALEATVLGCEATERHGQRLCHAPARAAVEPVVYKGRPVVDVEHLSGVVACELDELVDVGMWGESADPDSVRHQIAVVKREGMSRRNYTVQ